MDASQKSPQCCPMWCSQVWMMRMNDEWMNDVITGGKRGPKGWEGRCFSHKHQVLLNSFYLLAFSGDCPHRHRHRTWCDEMQEKDSRLNNLAARVCVVRLYSHVLSSHHLWLAARLYSSLKLPEYCLFTWVWLCCPCCCCCCFYYDLIFNTFNKVWK